MSVRAATADSATAAALAAGRPASISTAVPTAGTATVPKHGPIIATVSGATGNSERNPACRIKVPFRSHSGHHPNVGTANRPLPILHRDPAPIESPENRHRWGCAAASAVAPAGWLTRFRSFQNEGESVL